MELHLYRLGGRTVACDRPLHGIAAPAARGAKAAIEIRFAPAGRSAPRAKSWFHSWAGPHGKGAPRLRFGFSGRQYLLDAPRAARFLVSMAGDQILCFPSRGLAQSSFYHLLLDQVLPLAFGLKGDLVLHASAVVPGDEALALSGPSGRGKSTLAAHLAARGAQILTDDCLVLREVGGAWRAFPFDQGIRLFRNSARAALGAAAEGAEVAEGSGKVRILRHAAIGFRRQPVPLGAIILPQARRRALRGPALARLTPREAMMQLLPQTFFFEIQRKLALRDQFERLSRLVDRVPAYRLDMPAGFGALRATGDGLLALLSGERTAAA